MLIYSGDAAYPLNNFLMTPFRNTGNLTENQHSYNRRVSGCRQIVETAIGQLKGRFRKLQNLYCLDVENTCTYITAAGVLHNMCIVCDDDIQDFLNRDVQDGDPNHYPPLFGNAMEGVCKRLELMQMLEIVLYANLEDDW